MFPELPPFAESSNELEAALLELGKRGGILDANDDLDRGPLDLIVDLTLSANNPNNGTHTAGTTFMGQFIDHDITFDLTSRLGQATDPALSPNFRTPGLDLDSVYGGGPHANPELYEIMHGRRSERGIKFKVESGGAFEDLPRQGNTAIIPDPRNDENLVISGLHAAFLLFHNNVVDLLTKSPDHLTDDIGVTQVAGRSRPVPSSQELFGKARRLMTWHYQWMVVHEFCRSLSARRLSMISLRMDENSTGPKSRKFRLSLWVRRTASAIPWCDPLTGQTLRA
jgi:hypothetical protein